MPVHHDILGDGYSVGYPAYHHAYDYGVDTHPHFKEEEHSYSGEAKEKFWPTRDHKYVSEANQSGVVANLFQQAFNDYGVSQETKSDHFRSAEEHDSESIFEHK